VKPLSPIRFHSNIQSMSNLKIAIGIASQGTIHTKTAYSVIETIRLNKQTEFLPIFRYGGYIAENKAKIVEIAQNCLCSHVFFVDHDIVFNHKAFATLLAHDKDIIGVDYNYRYLPLKKMTVDIGEKSDKEPYIVKAVGGGFLLVKMKVFDKLKRPYFPMEQDEDGNRVVTEDFGFYEEARKAGFKVWCDPTLSIKHEGFYEY